MNFPFFDQHPTALQIANKNLADAEEGLLKALQDREYACAMVNFRESQVKLLTKFIGERK